MIHSALLEMPPRRLLSDSVWVSLGHLFSNFVPSFFVMQIKYETSKTFKFVLPRKKLHWALTSILCLAAYFETGLFLFYTAGLWKSGYFQGKTARHILHGVYTILICLFIVFVTAFILDNCIHNWEYFLGLNQARKYQASVESK